MVPPAPVVPPRPSFPKNPPRPPAPPAPPAGAQVGTVPGVTGLPPPAASSEPIWFATDCNAGPKLASQIDDRNPLVPKAVTACAMRTDGSAKRPSVAVQECATCGQGQEAAPQEVSMTLGDLQVTV